MSKDGDGFFTGVITATSYSGIDLSNVTGAQGDFSIADKIVHTGDTDTVIRFPSADTITAETAGSERVRITSAGLVGVNVTPTSHNDTTAFQVHDTYNSQGYPRLRLTNQSSGSANSDGFEISLDGSNLHAILRQRENADIHFYTNNTEKLRITSAGKVGINEISPDSMLHISGDSATAQIRLQRSNSASNTNDYGRIYFESTSNYLTGEISVARESGEDNGYMHFKTASGGTLTERLRIASDGKLFTTRTHASSNTGDHPAVDIDTYSNNGSPAAAMATGIDFSVEGVHKKRLAVTYLSLIHI